jgi:hypothetical protein
MQATKTTEEIEIKTFSFANESTAVVTSMINIPLGMSQFALAAMFKGLAEHFFDPLGSGESMPPAMREQIDADLAALKSKVSSSKLLV